MRAPVLLLVLALAGCGGESVTDQVRSDGAATELVVEVVAREGAAAQRWTLTCDPAGGDHPDPEAACRDLAAADAPFAPLPTDLICTEQYGGPQTARITGTHRGEPVDVSLSRIDGCRISQWDALGAVLPGPVGVDPGD